MPILVWIVRHGEGSSVLSASPKMFSMSPEHAQTMAFMTGALLEWGLYFLNIFFFSSALVVTAGLIWMILAREDSSLAASLTTLGGQGKKITRFSALVLGGVMVTTLLNGLFMYLVMSNHALASGMRSGIGTSLWILIEVPLAFFIARPALILIRNKESLPSQSSIRLARIFAMGTVVAQSLVAILISVGLSHLSSDTTNALEVQLRNVIISVLTTIPFMATFIALSVLGLEDGEPIELSSPKEVSAF